MIENKKEYLKIWFSDIEEAADYFDQNQKHLGEFLLNVYRSYAELPTCFSCKRVEKYFKTYQKQINYIKGQKIKGALRVDKQDVKESTLVGSLLPTLVGSLLPKDKREKIKEKEDNNKDKIHRSFFHLSITESENKKLLELGYSQSQLDLIYDKIQNYNQNKKYKSLYLTAKNWVSDLPKNGVDTTKSLKQKQIEEAKRRGYIVNEFGDIISA